MLAFAKIRADHQDQRPRLEDLPKAESPPDRHLDLRAAAWNFSNEVMRRLFHGNSLSDLKDLLIPFFGNVKVSSSFRMSLRRTTVTHLELIDNR